MNPEEARMRAFDKQYEAHLASMAHTGDHDEIQAEADDWHELASILDALRALQGSPHHPSCDVHRVGSTDFPWCSCGRDARIKQAGGKAKR